MTDKMTELVRRADVQDEIDRWLDSVGTVLVGKGLSSYGELIGCLEDAPAADVAPVRHGKWVKIGADKRGRGGIWHVCSVRGANYLSLITARTVVQRWIRRRKPDG